MSNLKETNGCSIEEEELRNLLRIPDTIDDLLDEVDKVVQSTKNDLFYVTSHEIKKTYSSILDKVLERPNNITVSIRNVQKEDDQQSRITTLDETIGKDMDLLHTKESLDLQLHPKPYGKPKGLVLVENKMNLQPIASPQKIGHFGRKRESCCKLEEFSLHNKKSDVAVVESLDSICKKRKIDFLNEFAIEVTIQQTCSINMTTKQARKHFNGPIGIRTDSIAVILYTKKPTTPFKYPIRKPKYNFSRMSQSKLKRVGQKISVTIYSNKERRKITAYPYVEDYIELTDFNLARELDEEYNKIVQSDCRKILEKEENHFLNSPNRIIKLIGSPSGSSTEDSSETECVNNCLANTNLQEKTEEINRFQYNLENGKQKWKNTHDTSPVLTETETKSSTHSMDIVPLEMQTDLVNMFNISKNFTQISNNNNNNLQHNSQDLDPNSDCSLNSLTFSNGSSQSNILEFGKKMKTDESILNPFTSSISIIDTLPDNLLSNEIDREDQDSVENDDVTEDNEITISNDNTLIGDDSVHVQEDIEENIRPLVDSKLKVDGSNFTLVPNQINIREVNNPLNIDQNSCENSTVQMNEVNERPLDNTNINDSDTNVCTTVCKNFNLNVNEHILSSLDIALDSFMVDLNKKHVLDEQNISPDVATTSKDITIISDSNIIGGLNTPDSKAENVSPISNKYNDNIIYLLDSDDEENVSIHDSADIEDTIVLSDSDSSYSNKSLINNTPEGNGGEENISEPSVNEIVIPCTRITNPRLPQPEAIIDLLDSSSDSVISINSGMDIYNCKKENTTMLFLEDQDDVLICDINNTSNNGGIATNHNTVSVLDSSTPFKDGESVVNENYTIENTTKPFSDDVISDINNTTDNINVCISSNHNTVSFLDYNIHFKNYENLNQIISAKINNLLSFNKFTSEGVPNKNDPSPEKEFSSVEDIPYSTSKIESAFIDFVDDHIEDDITSISNCISTKHTDIFPQVDFEKDSITLNTSTDTPKLVCNNININESADTNENSDYNEKITRPTVVVCEVEQSSNSIPCIADFEQVVSLCATNNPVYNSRSIDITLACSDNANVAAPDKTTETTPSELGLRDNQLTSTTHDFSLTTTEKTVGVENIINPILNSCNPEQIDIPPCDQIIPNILLKRNPSDSSLAVPNLKLTPNSDTNPSLPDPDIKPENTSKKMLEILYINSEIGIRPSLLNETSYNVPKLNLDVSQTYIPTINTEIDSCDVPEFDLSIIDDNQNCTITSEYGIIEECNDDGISSEKNDCDKTEEGVKVCPEILDLNISSISLPPGPTPSLNNYKWNDKTEEELKVCPEILDLNISSISLLPDFTPSLNNYKSNDKTEEELKLCPEILDLNISLSPGPTPSLNNYKSNDKTEEGLKICPEILDLNIRSISFPPDPTPSLNNYKSNDETEEGLKVCPEILDRSSSSISLPPGPTPSLNNYKSNDKTEEELKVCPEILDLNIRSNSLLPDPTPTCSPPSIPSNPTIVTTGIKRSAPSSDSESNKKHKPSSSNKPETQPDYINPFESDQVDANEIADNNDPKWKLYRFSDPQDFFQAVRNQWSVPMPSPHINLTRRFYNNKSAANTISTNYLIPGNKTVFNIECLKIYEDQLHQIKMQSSQLKHDLDRSGQYWNRRRINSTIDKLRNLDQMHDQLRDAWDDAYNFYTFSIDSKTNHSAWYVTEFNKNEVARSLEMFRAYENYYGHAE